tara:strand:- start:15 stop:140 length:126 start_codon:yes stop_codon:yes gene_type:complete
MIGYLFKRLRFLGCSKALRDFNNYWKYVHENLIFAKDFRIL